MPLDKLSEDLASALSLPHIMCLNCGKRAEENSIKKCGINVGMSTRYEFYCSCGMGNTISYQFYRKSSYKQTLHLKSSIQVFEYSNSQTHYYDDNYGATHLDGLNLDGFIIYKKFMKLANFK